MSIHQVRHPPLLAPRLLILRYVMDEPKGLCSLHHHVIQHQKLLCLSRRGRRRPGEAIRIRRQPEGRCVQAQCPVGESHVAYTILHKF